ncbi:MAG: hypothetical protein WKF90_05865 [Pyrinomonadaceae bacterium]|jgi:hypothetical protein
MDRIFQILAVILIGVAAFFLWNNNADAAFASAVFGAVSFFLSVRFQVKTRLKSQVEQQKNVVQLDEDEMI